MIELDLLQPPDNYSSGASISDSLKRARELGLSVVLPEADQLFLDIDSENDMTSFIEVSVILKDYISSWTTTPSKSGGAKQHVTVKFVRPVTHFERIAFQAMLGSDRKREAYSYVGLMKGHTNPTMFFEKPQVKSE